MNLNRNIVLKVRFRDFIVIYILILLGICVSFFDFSIGKIMILAFLTVGLINIFFCYKIIISNEGIRLVYLLKRTVEYSFDEISKIEIFFIGGRYSESHIEVYGDKKYSHIVTPLGSRLIYLYCILKLKGVLVKYYNHSHRTTILDETSCESILKEAEERGYIIFE